MKDTRLNSKLLPITTFLNKIVPDYTGATALILKVYALTIQSQSFSPKNEKIKVKSTPRHLSPEKEKEHTGFK